VIQDFARLRHGMVHPEPRCANVVEPIRRIDRAAREECLCGADDNVFGICRRAERARKAQVSKSGLTPRLWFRRS